MTVSLVVDTVKVWLSVDVNAESVFGSMPASVRKPVSMDVCMRKSFSFPDSYDSIALASKKTFKEQLLFPLCYAFFRDLFYLSFIRISLFYKKEIQTFLSQISVFFLSTKFYFSLLFSSFLYTVSAWYQRLSLPFSLCWQLPLPQKQKEKIKIYSKQKKKKYKWLFMASYLIKFPDSWLFEI